MKNKDSKKAQITVFMLVGIILVMLFGVLIAYGPEINSKLPSSIESVEAFSENCFDQANTCMLYKLGINNANLDFNPNFPLISNIKTNAERYFSKTSKQCQDNFNSLEGLRIQNQDIFAQVHFNDFDTSIDAAQEIEIEKGESRTELSTSRSKIPVAFKKNYDLADDIRNHRTSLLKNEFINVDLLENKYANIYQPNVIVITDIGSRIKDESYKFTFLKS